MHAYTYVPSVRCANKYRQELGHCNLFQSHIGTNTTLLFSTGTDQIVWLY
jgi:hypothetical protein